MEGWGCWGEGSSRPNQTEAGGMQQIYHNNKKEALCSLKEGEPYLIDGVGGRAKKGPTLKRAQSKTSWPLKRRAGAKKK